MGHLLSEVVRLKRGEGRKGTRQERVQARRYTQRTLTRQWGETGIPGEIFGTSWRIKVERNRQSLLEHVYFVPADVLFASCLRRLEARGCGRHMALSRGVMPQRQRLRQTVRPCTKGS